jgi:TetR/AcrR family transcriptional regulator, regulator of mycofactocin system
VPGTKRDATRQRLLDAANARFRTTGYEHSTAAMIADDAGVTERTFFRYFPTKAEVLIANWEGHREALREVLAGSQKSKTIDVVRDSLVAFTDRLQAELDSGIDSVVQLFLDPGAFAAMTSTLLEIETDFAIAIAKRSSRGMDDLDVRVAANAAFGIFRASVRAYMAHPQGPPISEMVATSMRRLRPVFAALQDPAPGEASASTAQASKSKATRADLRP